MFTPHTRLYSQRSLEWVDPAMITKSTLSRHSCAHLVPPLPSPLSLPPSCAPAFSPAPLPGFSYSSEVAAPGVLCPLILHSRHASQQHLQRPRPGAPRALGGPSPHGDSRKVCLNRQGSPRHHVWRTTQRDHHQKPFPGCNRATFHL
ncbi:hypothetical protein Q8A73_014750 [Channa argus]|nr:hypothetical protein Q8A73_014750 [Channa argus]